MFPFNLYVIQNGLKIVLAKHENIAVPQNVKLTRYMTDGLGVKLHVHEMEKENREFV